MRSVTNDRMCGSALLCLALTLIAAPPARYDSTVRNAMGQIIQFLYGEDGMDGTAIESQKLEVLTMNDNKFRATFGYDFSDNPDWLDPGTAEELRTNIQARQLVEGEYKVRGKAA